MNEYHSKRSLTQPVVRLCIAADIERYSRFGNLDAEHAQEQFVYVLQHACRRVGLATTETSVARSGDGQFLVLPPGVDESSAIPAFVDGLSLALRHTNEGLSTHLHLRLRVAMHRGLLKPSINGWVGHAAIAVHRLLDSTSLRIALRHTPAANFALAVGDSLYRDVIAHDYAGLSAKSFRRTVVTVRSKGFTEQAWIYLSEEPTCSATGRFAHIVPPPGNPHLP